MRPQVPETGWELVAQRDEAAPLVRAIVSLDPATEYTRSDIADAAGIPLKTLYLADALDDLVDVGALDRTDDDEATFLVNADSAVVQAARAFDDAVADRLGTVDTE